MFIEVSELKALIIDLDSFPEPNDVEWDKVVISLRCLFISSHSSRLDSIKSLYPNAMCTKYGSLLFLNDNSVKQFLNSINMRSYETAFVSCNFDNVKSLMDYPIGTILISNSEVIPYNKCGFCPDFKLDKIHDILMVFDKTYVGFMSEMGASKPWISNLSSNKTQYAHMILSEIEYNDVNLRIIAGGRYFNKHNVRNKTHQLSNRITRNKGTYRVAQDNIFTPIFSNMVSYCNEYIDKISGITRVPPRPGNEDRFCKTVNELCNTFGFNNYLNNMECISSYPQQKSFGFNDRLDNVNGKFKFNKHIHGQHIVLIDDVITTGSTALECAKVLFNNGASAVTAIVLGINQYEIEWRTNDYKPLNCESCGSEMVMKFNGRSEEAFFGCSGFRSGCRKSLRFEDGFIKNNENNSITRQNNLDIDFLF